MRFAPSAQFLHTCAVCGVEFYGPRTTFLCGDHAALRAKRPRSCVVCGGPKRRIRRGFMCGRCALNRRRENWRRIARRKYRSAQDQDALHQGATLELGET